ncbi:TolC family protein [Phycisphaera mikurensis]|uniref:Putative efflux system outer membrane protein n=1 Tax=Phycisphaera mikurensis (strain NBRC 102666 / KCTC 22515 / FYK2301M01) TaxID=1142394 RepID=I0ICD3_PHYMF|nr:TolC family protein [Phycisphaera mikurensis]MBB6442201.1 hypothetical protein [Phycisphaera mikurensis]BAM02921.1 putative efflux system outer membrane protein [Phycisphaera mikurensis NBRC 102666]
MQARTSTAPRTARRRTPLIARRRALAAGAVAASLVAAGGCRSPLDEARRASIDFRHDLLRDFREQVEASVIAPDAEQSAFADRLAEASIPDPLEDPAVWWSAASRDAVFGDGATLEASLDDLLKATLVHSSQVKVFSDLPLIRRTAVAEAEGRFTPRFFAEGRYDNTNEPVGSTLQTGGPDRFKEEEILGEIGLRKRTRSGADVTLSERLSYTDNNSVFFVPNPQSRAQLALSVVQPLLRGAGTGYNTSILEIAEIDSEAAREEFVRQASFHLMEVTRAYWNLYLVRSRHLQDQRLFEATQSLVDKAEARAGLDTPGEVLLRSRSALNERRSGLIRSKAAIRNAEDRIKSLVNDPELIGGGRELVLGDLPTAFPEAPKLVPTAEAALLHRPEVNQAFLQWRAAAVRSGIAQNETLPQLDAIAEVATSGLREGGETGEAIDDQFNSDLSFTLGLRFETPIGRSERDARALRRRLELRSQGNQVKVTIETVLLEVKVGVREVRTAYEDLVSRHGTLLATREDTRILQERWDGGLDTSGLGGVTYLNLLLDAQVRQNAAERAYAEAQATYRVALAGLERVKGTMLRYRGIEAVEGEAADGLPELRLEPSVGEPLAADAWPRTAGPAAAAAAPSAEEPAAPPAEPASGPAGEAAPVAARRPAPLLDAGEDAPIDHERWLAELEELNALSTALTNPW